MNIDIDLSEVVEDLLEQNKKLNLENIVLNRAVKKLETLVPPMVPVDQGAVAPPTPPYWGTPPDIPTEG